MTYTISETTWLAIVLFVDTLDDSLAVQVDLLNVHTKNLFAHLTFTFALAECHRVPAFLGPPSFDHSFSFV